MSYEIKIENKKIIFDCEKSYFNAIREYLNFKDNIPTFLIGYYNNLSFVNFIEKEMYDKNNCVVENVADDVNNTMYYGSLCTDPIYSSSYTSSSSTLGGTISNTCYFAEPENYHWGDCSLGASSPPGIVLPLDSNSSLISHRDESNWRTYTIVYPEYEGDDEGKEEDTTKDTIETDNPVSRFDLLDFEG